MRCVPAVIRPSRRDVRHDSAEEVVPARASRGAVVADWVGAGAVSGLYLGAAWGLIVDLPLVGPRLWSAADWSRYGSRNHFGDAGRMGSGT